MYLVGCFNPWFLQSACIINTFKKEVGKKISRSVSMENQNDILLLEFFHLENIQQAGDLINKNTTSNVCTKLFS